VPSVVITISFTIFKQPSASAEYRASLARAT
jgi:hypothetical protein